VPIGPITRARAKKLKEELNGHEGQHLIHLIQVQEEPNLCGIRG